MPELSRRHLLQSAAIGTIAVALTDAAPRSAQAAASLRAHFHMTPPSGWLCDSQRPVLINGKYEMYYLHSAQDNGDGGWDHTSTTDGVKFNFQGTVIPLQPNFPAWTGCTLIDSNNTAGYGAGAVIALATRPTGGVRKYQEQYLFYSTDGGYSFTARPNPVIVNTDGRSATTSSQVANAEWFRDPKVAWDAARNQWVCAIGRQRYAAFYTSPDLINWTLRRNFDYSDHNLGGIECPDLFTITADDGTTHWIFAGSMDAYNEGLPCTYAYWTGTWDGNIFTQDSQTPQWLDWGWDWYGAITWPSADSPSTKRLAVGWMNNWKYANRQVPTDSSDGYNGQNSIVRELHLARQSNGRYTLLSQPISALEGYATSVRSFANQTVNGSYVLPWNGRAYELELDIAWSTATNIGVSVGRSSDGSRHTNVGKYGSDLYVDRGPSNLSGYSLQPYTRAAAPIDPNARAVHLRIFVDMQSVEVFVNAGYTILSQQVQFTSGDDGISFYSDGGSATFSNISLHEFASVI